MTLQIVGAGLGRTGTHSLKVALEQLLGAPCYHMVEVFAHPEHAPRWDEAMHDRPVDWGELFRGYAATVDMPGAMVWGAISQAFPDAYVLLSTRSSAAEWYASASGTIFPSMDLAEGTSKEWRTMAETMFARLTPDWRDRDATIAGYERHNAAVRAAVPPARLIEWQPTDGWTPLCAALRCDVPEGPFPLTNTRAEFRERSQLDG